MKDIPKLRTDLNITIRELDKDKFILVEDPYLITESIALPLEYQILLDFLNKKNTFNSLFNNLSKHFEGLKEDQLKYIIQNLESVGLLENESYHFAKQQINEYLNSSVRPARSAGISYPEDKNELSNYLDNISNKDIDDYTPEGILAPHIDLRLENESHEVYGKAFSYLNYTKDTDVFIILGTAHYKSSDDLMFTRKDFSSPFGLTKTDTELLDVLEKNIDITYDDISHLPEHSIETHLIFLQNAMKGKDYKILPILTGSFHEYIESGKLPNKHSKYTKTLELIKKYYHSNNIKYTVLSSGDLSHVGKKFGDDSPAMSFFDEVKKSDYNLMKNLTYGNKNSFLKEIINIKDKYRVCGTAPFHTALELTDNEMVKPLEYSYWNEAGTDSAVSFFSGII